MEGSVLKQCAYKKKKLQTAHFLMIIENVSLYLKKSLQKKILQKQMRKQKNKTNQAPRYHNQQNHKVRNYTGQITNSLFFWLHRTAGS